MATTQVVDPEAVRRKLKFDYMRARNEVDFRSLDPFFSLLAHFEKSKISLRDLIQDAANQIQRQWRIRWVMIGLRSDLDGKYRYHVQAGMREEAWQQQKLAVYKLEDFGMSGGYVLGEISNVTRVYLEEENPLASGDEVVVNRPALLNLKRKSADESLEVDFLDTLIIGPDNSLLGWIDYSGTTAAKFPDAIVIRQIELVAFVIAAAIRSGAR